MSSYELWKKGKDVNIRTFKSIVRLISSSEYTDDQKLEKLEKIEKFMDKIGVWEE
jgi:hypothetical protein